MRFLVRGQGNTLFLTAREAVFAFNPSAAPVWRPERMASRTRAAHETLHTARTVVRMRLLATNPAPELVGLEEL